MIGRAGRAFRRLRERLEHSAVILMYHRVTDLDHDPWGLAVTPERFEAHLRAIRSLARPVALGELADSIRRGSITSGSIAITFDDGYRDNLTVAKPLLERYEIPATIFVTTAKLGLSREFWWDELEQIVLLPEELPGQLELSLPGGVHEFTLESGRRYTPADRRADRSKLLWYAAPGSRMALYRDLHDRLRRLGVDDRGQALATLATWAGASVVGRESHATVSAEDLHSLGLDGLIEIGAHTRHHPFLSNLAPEAQREEIIASKGDLEALLQRQVAGFAYPHGDAPPESRAIVRENFDYAVGTRARRALGRDDIWTLPRFAVPDCEGPHFSSIFIR